MSQSDKQLSDWVNLSADSSVLHLWDCLHDGELLSCRSDLVERRVTLEFRVRHLVHATGDDLRFLLQLENVESVRANVYFRWPGEFFIPEGATREEQGRLIEEYQAKWREESIGWLSFEGSLSTDPLQISEAELARGSEGVTLKLGGHLDGERFHDLYCSVFIRGSQVSASRSDGQPFGLERFVEMGRQYWEEFSQRRQE
jgi:hypothetical protein